MNVYVLSIYPAHLGEWIVRKVFYDEVTAQKYATDLEAGGVPAMIYECEIE